MSRKIYGIMLALLFGVSVYAAQYSVLFGTTSIGRGPTQYNAPLLVHFTGPTTAQIHNDAPRGTQGYASGNVFVTLITTGSKYGVSAQNVSGVTQGIAIASTIEAFPVSTMTTVAIMFWVLRDTYPAATARQDFTWGQNQTGGGLIIGGFGDMLNGTSAPLNPTHGFQYNPNATGYDTFQGTIPVRNDGKWHHVICVISRYNKRMKQFVDGIKDWSSLGTAASELTMGRLDVPTNVPVDFRINGYATVAGGFQGRFDEWYIVKTSSREITDNECRQFYYDAIDRRKKRQ